VWSVTTSEVEETRTLLNDGFFSPGYAKRFGDLLSALDDANKRIAELESERASGLWGNIDTNPRVLGAMFYGRWKHAEAKLAAVRELAENLPEEDWQDPPGCGWHGAFSEAADMLKAILDK
jgi:hypothetical protein